MKVEILVPTMLGVFLSQVLHLEGLPVITQAGILIAIAFLTFLLFELVRYLLKRIR